jgi:hypothetical protein
MAGFTSGRKFARHVIWDGGFLKIRRVTGHARSRETQILPHGSALMTFVALHYGMRSKQRESVEVLFYQLG